MCFKWAGANRICQGDQIMQTDHGKWQRVQGWGDTFKTFPRKNV